MDVARTVEMLLLDPEHALHFAALVDPVPERTVMGLEIVTPPGAPAGEFALGFDVDAGENGECRFRELVHGFRPYCGSSALKSDPGGMCKRRSQPASPQSSGQGTNAP